MEALSPRRTFRHRQPRRLEPVPPPRAAAQHDAATLTGTLIRIHDSGYGFLMTGKGSPDFFIARAQVDSEAWIKGARFRFTPLPPKPGTRAGRVGNPVLLSVPPVRSGGSDAQA